MSSPADVSSAPAAASHAGVLHLIYHRVLPEAQSYSYAITTARFREHLSVITGATRTPAAITFDDGNRSQFQHAVPVLKEFGLRATFFVTSAWTDVDAKSMTSAE